jgi:RHS repeat-associated protein
MGETQATTKNWMGSLLEGQRDAGGLMYMRNRYYDPKTGQFTQTDPIGLAGGLNTYGFAAGDPVSYADPYGLCPESAGGDGKTDSYSDCPPGTSGWYGHRVATGEGNEALNQIGGTLAACNESASCQGVLHLASLGSTGVYQALGQGVVRYVGITRNFAARAATHLRTRQLSIRAIDGLEDLSRADARAVEQVLIETYRLARNGGTLLNRINSIARTNPKYAEALERGRELLQHVNYPGF